MHETGLARRSLAVVLDRTSGTAPARIRRVRGWIAETEALSPESLALHFAAHARGTRARDAVLDLRIVRVEARCDQCRQVYTPDHHVLLCPACGSDAAELLGEPGIAIETVEVE